MKQEFTRFCRETWPDEPVKGQFINNLLTVLSQKSRRGLKPGGSGINVWNELYNLKVPYDKRRKPLQGKEIIAALRGWLIKHQDERCCYCRRYLLNNAWAKPIDHILPLNLYPHYSLTLRNLAVACVNCNLTKTKTPWWPHISSGPVYPARHMMGGAFHYQYHSYNKHVRWFRYSSNNFSFSIYKGISEEGRHLCRNLLESQVKKEILCCRDDGFARAFNDIHRERISEKSMPELDTFLKSLEHILFTE